MPRTTLDQVRAVINTPLSDEQIIAWIGVASSIVNQYATRCSLAGCDLITTIETLMTAHLIAMMGVSGAGGGFLQSRTIGTSSETYRAYTGAGLNGSPYGFQLQMLDPCGVIGTIGQPVAKGCVL